MMEQIALLVDRISHSKANTLILQSISNYVDLDLFDRSLIIICLDVPELIYFMTSLHFTSLHLKLRC